MIATIVNKMIFTSNSKLRFLIYSKSSSTISKFAPWINKVYLVTDDQIPTWLNIDHEKLVVIDHTDIIAKEYLPVFNSNLMVNGVRNSHK